MAAVSNLCQWEEEGFLDVRGYKEGRGRGSGLFNHPPCLWEEALSGDLKQILLSLFLVQIKLVISDWLDWTLVSTSLKSGKPLVLRLHSSVGPDVRISSVKCKRRCN